MPSSFDKGCYTGQEVIARAHYRGRVKRRLQRFVSRGPATLAPGQGGTLSDGERSKSSMPVQMEDGRCEFLAVAPLVHGTSPKPPRRLARPRWRRKACLSPYPLPD